MLALSLVAAGCAAIVPETKRSERVLAERLGPERVQGGKAVRLTATFEGGTVQVAALRSSLCARQRFQTVEQKSTQKATLWVASHNDDTCPPTDDACVATEALIIVLTIPVLVVSGIYTGIVVGASHEKTDRYEKVAGEQKTECPQPLPGARVKLLLADGTELSDVTDAAGRASFVVPPDQPAGAVARLWLDAPAGVAAIVTVGAPASPTRLGEAAPTGESSCDIDTDCPAGHLCVGMPPHKICR